MFKTLGIVDVQSLPKVLDSSTLVAGALKVTTTELTAP